MKIEHSESLALPLSAVFHKMRNFMLMLISLLLVNVNVSTLAFSSNDKEVIEKTNNVVVKEGYVVENFILKEKKVDTPTDIAVSKNGNLYVLVKNKVLKISEKNIVEEIYVDPNYYQSIKKLAVDSYGNIFALKDNNAILKISKEANGIYLSFDKNQVFLSDIVIDRNDNIYLSDLNKNCIYKFTPRGRKSIYWGKRYGFRKLMSITVDGYGKIYVLDIEQMKILEMIPEEEKAPVFTDLSKVRNPYAISSDNSGSFIYLIDKDNNLLYLVSKFNVIQEIAIFSRWHMLSGGITLDRDNNIYLTTGGKSNRIICIRPLTKKLYTQPNDLIFDGDVKISCRDYLAYKPELLLPDGIAFDIEGNLYIANEWGSNLLKIDSNKNIEILLTENDGLKSPEDIAVDRKGNIYVSDDVVSKVFCINKNDKKISVYADQKFGLKEPAGIAFDKQNNLFIADERKKAVIKITPDKKSEIFADSTDGLVTPEDIIIDDYSFIYVADDSGKIFRFDPDGNGRILADESYGLKGPESLALDKDGNLFVGDEETNEIYEFKPNGEWRVYAKLLTRTLRFLGGLAFSSRGELYVASAEIGASRIFKIEPRGRGVTEESAVRKGEYQLLKLFSREDGLRKPSCLAWNKKGQLFISDEGLGIVFLCHKNKLIPYIKIDGMCSEAIIFDKKGNLYIGDECSGNIYFVSSSKDIKVIASRNSGLHTPEGITVDEEDNIYIADEKANSIFKVKNGNIGIFMDETDGIGDTEEVVYNNGFLYIANEDRLLIIDAKGKIISKLYISDPEGIAIGQEGNIYVSSDSASKIYMINKKGKKIVIADFYDGLRQPESLVIDNKGSLLVADEEAGCIFKIVPKGDDV